MVTYATLPMLGLVIVTLTVTSVAPGFPSLSCLSLITQGSCLFVFSRLAPAAYTQSVCGEATRKYRALRLDVGNFSLGLGV